MQMKLNMMYLMYRVLSFLFEGIVRFNLNMHLSKSSYKTVTSNYIFIIYYITVYRRKKGDF